MASVIPFGPVARILREAERLKRLAACGKEKRDQLLNSDAYLMFLMLLAMAPVKWQNPFVVDHRGIYTQKTEDWPYAAWPHSVAMEMLTGGDMPEGWPLTERFRRSAKTLGFTRDFSQLIGSCGSSKARTAGLLCKKIRRDLLMATGLSKAGKKRKLDPAGTKWVGLFG